MSKDNIGKKARIRSANTIPTYTIQNYSETHGGQYLLKADYPVDGCSLFGWEPAQEVFILSTEELANYNMLEEMENRHTEDIDIV